MGVFKFVLGRLLGQEDDFDDDMDDADDIDDIDDMDDDSADDDDADDDDADDDADDSDDDGDADDGVGPSHDELNDLHGRAEQAGVQPAPGADGDRSRVAFGSKFCPTRHGCSGIASCDACYGAPED